MKKKIVLVGETNMSDGVDLIHKWSSVKQALKSGRFDFCEEMWDDEDMSWEEVTEMTDLLQFIETVSYPFYLVESEN